MSIVSKLRFARKPDEIVIFQDGHQWRYRRTRPNGVSTISDASWPSEIAAAGDAAKLTIGHANVRVILPASAEFALVAKWQIEGAEAYKSGRPFDTCWNEFQRQGYLAVAESESSISVWGWPSRAITQHQTVEV